MKKHIYRIRKIQNKGVAMFMLEEGTKANRKREKPTRRWQVVTLAYDLDILRGVRDDIARQTAEEHNGLRK